MQKLKTGKKRKERKVGNAILSKQLKVPERKMRIIK